MPAITGPIRSLAEAFGLGQPLDLGPEQEGVPPMPTAAVEQAQCETMLSEDDLDAMEALQDMQDARDFAREGECDCHHHDEEY